MEMACAPVAKAESKYEQFQKGITYASYRRDAYLTVESDRSLQALRTTGANWVALLVTWYQDTYKDSLIKPDTSRTPTDTALIHAIQAIHRLDMRIMLKPHIDLLADNNHWRGQIDPENVEAWFKSYRAFITHYAKMAQAYGVESLCIGTELDSMTQKKYTADWLGIIEDIRRIFPNELTYAANWRPKSVWQDLGFWKELDYVGIDAYFPLTEKKNPTVSELKEAWQPWVSQIEAWQKLVGKQIVFTEIGYRDVDGANICPWDWWTSTLEDQQEQADCYEAALETFWGKSWLQGIFWWAWTVWKLPRDYTPWGKLAQTVLSASYAKPFFSMEVGESLCQQWSPSSRRALHKASELTS